jgi:hypothetical protein
MFEILKKKTWFYDSKIKKKLESIIIINSFIEK